MRNQPFSRNQRVADQILREVAQIVSRDVADPRVAAVTLSEVELSKDLRHARVYVTVPEHADAEACVAALNHAAAFVRHQLGNRVRMKRLPALRFIYDNTLDRATRMDRLLAESERERDTDGDRRTEDAVGKSSNTDDDE